MNLAQALLYMILMHKILLLLVLAHESADQALVLVLRHTNLERRLIILGLLHHTIELFHRGLDVILFNDLLEFTFELLVQFVTIMTLSLWISPIENTNFLVGMVQLPCFALVFLIEVNNKEWMFEVDEEVPHIVIFLWLFFVRNNVDCCVAILLRFIDLLLQLLLRVPAGDVLNAKIRAQVFTLFHFFDLDWLTERFTIWHICHRGRASFLRTRCCTLGISA